MLSPKAPQAPGVVAVEPQGSASLNNDSLISSISRNTLFGVLSNATQFLTRFATVPIVIAHLGLDGYGIWNIIMTTATYMRFGAVGVKTAYQKYVAEATGSGDYRRAAALLSTGTAFMVCLSACILIPGALYARRIVQAAGVPNSFLNSAAGAVAVLAAIMAVANVGAVFEAIVMGGHRIDLVRKFSTCLTVAESVAIIGLLHLGFGLIAMAAVMGASELLYIICCYIAAYRVVPQIRIRFSTVDGSMAYELLRFAGSYQLVNLLEVFYASVLPFAILRSYGAQMAGVYAVVTRVASTANVLQEPFLPPILSSGAMVYARGIAESMRLLIVKAVKAALALSMPALGFIAVFGATVAFAWTGQTLGSFQTAFVLVAAKCLFASLSLVALVLYRASGKAFLDNVRQLLRIAVILACALFASRIGFYGLLMGLALAEFLGMVFMMYALFRTYPALRPLAMLLDALKLSAATLIALGACVAMSRVPMQLNLPARFQTAFQLGLLAGTFCLSTVLALFLTRFVTPQETAAACRMAGRASRRLPAWMVPKRPVRVLGA